MKNVLKDHQDDYNINVAMLNKTRDENENLKKMFSQKDKLNEEKLKERNEVNKKLLQAATILKKQVNKINYFRLRLLSYYVLSFYIKCN